MAFMELETVQMVQDGLNGSVERQSTLADNLANVNTPGYKRKEVSFKDRLSEAYMEESDGVSLHKAHPKHFSFGTGKPVKPHTFQVNDTRIRNDGNNVDADRTMSRLSKNTLYFNGLSQIVGQQFNRIGNLVNTLRQP